MRQSWSGLAARLSIVPGACQPTPASLPRVRDGAHVPWATDFGKQCEMPNFPSAAERLHFEHVVEFKRMVQAAVPCTAGALILPGLVIVVRVLGRKRRIRNADS